MKCVICGKSFGGFLSGVGWTMYKDGGETHYCQDCFNNILKEEKSCFECVFFDLKDSFCKKIKAQLKATWHASCKGSMGYFSLLPLLHFGQAKDCRYFLDKKEYVEKAIRGQMKIQGKNHFIVCKYCGARYDSDKHFKCPNCGAISS